MEQIRNKLFELIRNLNKYEVKYCLVGGWAMILHGMFRTTKDIDLFVEASEDNLKRLLKALEDTFQEKILSCEEALKSFVTYSVVRYGTPQNFYIDIIFKIGEEISWEDVNQNTDYVKIESEEVGDLAIPVANIDILIKMKERASFFREQDRLDLVYLKKLKQSQTKNNTIKKR